MLRRIDELAVCVAHKRDDGVNAAAASGAELDESIEAIAPGIELIGIGGRRKRFPGKHGANPNDVGIVASAQPSRNIDGQSDVIIKASRRDVRDVVRLKTD